MKKPKIIIWGYPLHSHTHSYIHGSWYKTFQHLGYETHWFDDNNYPKDFDYSNCLFITEGYADNNIPIVDSSTYFVHICVNPEKYLNKNSRLIDIRFNVSEINDCNYSYSVDTSLLHKIDECAFYDGMANDNVLSNKFKKQIQGYEAIYLSWATDLLPHEFNENDIYIPRENKVYWVGSISESNQAEIKKFIFSLAKENIEFVHNNPWVNPLSWEQTKHLTQLSYIAPDIRGSAMRAHVNGKVDTGSNHKLIGYIPCRIFKNISYGQLGITNSRAVSELFKGLVLYSDNEENLLNIAKPNIQNIDLIKEQMNFVKKHHTYINRADSLLKLYYKEI
jgi:hypothetical protein